VAHGADAKLITQQSVDVDAFDDGVPSCFILLEWDQPLQTNSSLEALMAALGNPTVPSTRTMKSRRRTSRSS
jgi:hypothetical protein